MSVRPYQRDSDIDPEASGCEVLALTHRIRFARREQNKEQLARLLGQRGQWQRVRGFHDEAVGDLTEALSVSRSLQLTDLVSTNMIRLATARQYRGEHGAAAEMLSNLLVSLDPIGEASVWAFAQQHLGKVLAEMERWEEAIVCFEGAIRVRRQQGAETLLDSSLLALKEARGRCAE